MITGELKNKVDSIWDTLWTGGIASPITVLEQIKIGRASCRERV